MAQIYIARSRSFSGSNTKSREQMKAALNTYNLANDNMDRFSIGYPEKFNKVKNRKGRHAHLKLFKSSRSNLKFAGGKAQEDSRFLGQTL